MGDCGGGCPACVADLTGQDAWTGVEGDEGEEGDEGDEGDDTECKCGNCTRDQRGRSPNHVMSRYCSDCGDYVRRPEETRVARHADWDIHRQICDDCNATYEVCRSDELEHFSDDSMCECFRCHDEGCDCYLCLEEEERNANAVHTQRAIHEANNFASSTGDDHDLGH